MDKFIEKISPTKGVQRFLKYGAPFLVLMVGGSFGLREFASLRYEYSKRTMLKPEELLKEGIVMKKPGEVTLESEYEKIKNLDNENWKNIRGPRPYEEPSEDYLNLKNKNKAKKQTEV